MFKRVIHLIPQLGHLRSTSSFRCTNRAGAFSTFKYANDFPESGKLHDVGGDPTLLQSALPRGASDHDTAVQDWEKRVHATLGILSAKGLITTDELRYGIEQLPESSHLEFSYYEKWASSMLQASLARGLVSQEDINKFIYGVEEDDHVDATKVKPFPRGTVVQVRDEQLVTRWRKPHLRTPGYLFGATGVVERVAGKFKNPELLAFRQNAPEQWLYRIRFRQRDIWDLYDGALEDSLDVEVYHPWLEEVSSENHKSLQYLLDSPNAKTEDEMLQDLELHSCEDHSHNRAHDHDHQGDHDHDHHVHETRGKVEVTAIEREGPETPGQRISHGFVRLMLEKGLISSQELHAGVEAFDMFGADHQGAKLIVRAWIDPEFKERLLKDGNAAAAELGIMASNAHTHTKLVVVENDSKTHNLVVCTLCSCYPIGLLGPSPSWYKSRSYRARAVREPRKLLAEEFGLQLDNTVKVRVHDSTADCRYMVLPECPVDVANENEESLLQIVSRNGLIGVAKA